MKATYALVPKVLTPAVNPGQTAEIHLYMSGYGDVDQAKLYVSYVSTMVDAKNPPVMQTSIRGVMDKNGKFLGPIAGKEQVQTETLSVWGTSVGLNQGNFAADPTRIRPNTIGVRMCESSWDDLPPISLKLNTSNKTPPGDYTIEFVLTYSDGADAKSDKATVPIHINNWQEKHPKITAGAIIATILAVLVGVLVPFFSHV